MMPAIDKIKAKFKIPTLTFLDPAMNFLNSRNSREKIMIVALVGVMVVALDYLLIVKPMIGVFVQITPKIGSEQAALNQLKDDKRNSVNIDAEWTNLKTKLSESDQRFVAPNAMPLLLESLSKSASDSGIRITSLKPSVPSKAETPGFSRVPIRVNATGGGHELGRFLAKLESGKTFFKITNLKISGNEQEPKRHLIEIEAEAYRKSG